jgi:hypothetical protein
MADKFDLTKATTYREALILLNKSIEIQGGDIDEIKSQLAEISQLFSDYLPKHAAEHASIDKNIDGNKKDIAYTQEKLGELKKWNAADTVNLMVTAITAAIIKFFNS